MIYLLMAQYFMIKAKQVASLLQKAHDTTLIENPLQKIM